MAHENDIIIGGRLHSAATGNVVAGADEIFDDSAAKKQSEINQDQDIINQNQDEINQNQESINDTVAEAIENLEEEVADRYTKDEVNNIISRTPETDVIVIDVPTESQSDIAGWLDANTPSGTDPETGRSVRANKLYRVPGPENTTFSEWAWDGTAYIMLANKDYGIDDEPTPGSNNVAKSGGIYESEITLANNIDKGFIIDYNHLWNYVPASSISRYEENDNWNAIIIPVPEDAISVTVSGVTVVGRYTYETVFPELNVNKYNTIQRNDTGVIPYGTTYVLKNLRKEDNPDFNPKNIKVSLIRCQNGYHTSLPLLAGKKVSILGASIETFGEYSYGYDDNGDVEQNNRYPGTGTTAQGGNGNDVSNLNQTWWMQVINRCGAVLERVNAIGSSAVSTNHLYNYTSFIEGNHNGRVRCQDLGDPDVIFIQGLKNEPANADCTFDPTIPTSALNTLDIGQAYDKMCRLIMLQYPNARIIHVLQSRTSTETVLRRMSTVKQICDYYGHEYVDIVGISEVTTIETDSVHPDYNGMSIITDFVISQLESKYKTANVDKQIQAVVDKIAFESDESPYNSDPDVLSYFVDEENKIFAVLYKDGSVKKLVYTAEEENLRKIIPELYNSQALVREESPYDDPDVFTYFVDDENKVFMIQYTDGSIVKLVLTDEEIHTRDIMSKISSETNIPDDDVLKYLTDERGTCFGYVKTDGTVVIYKAAILNYDNQGNTASEKQLATIVSLIANGLDNVKISNNPKFMSTLHNLIGNEHVYINADNDNHVNLSPCISIIDDDTIDNQIPSSRGESEVRENAGGYFSVLLPFLLSLGAKYGKNLCPGLACEGQRVGLTPIYSSDDTYSELNENGQAVKWLHNNMGWNVLNHSMTAQLPDRCYFVDGIDSELADIILSRGTYVGAFNFHNTMVIDRLTGKWYEVNSTKTAWVERTPTKKYAQIFYREYINASDPNANHDGPWYFNRNFDFDYSWGEWFKRADELGLPYEKVIVHNGSTSHVCTVYAGRKYAYWSVRTTGTHNYPPIPATVNRISAITTVNDNNVRSVTYENRLKSQVDDCADGNTWMVIMTHFNDQSSYRNYYLSGVTYPDGDPNYPNEWIIPLKHDEILDIIGENVHDYINYPPSRLGISTWDEWHPAPGTQLKSIYDVVDYALSKGIDFVSPIEGWNTHGNVLNLGVDKNGQTFTYDTEAQTPYTNDEKSYLTIGADMSIRYYNSKS